MNLCLFIKAMIFCIFKRQWHFLFIEWPLPPEVLPAGILGDEHDLENDDLEDSFSDIPDDDLLMATLKMEKHVEEEKHKDNEADPFGSQSEDTELTDEELLKMTLEMEAKP